MCEHLGTDDIPNAQRPAAFGSTFEACVKLPRRVEPWNRRSPDAHPGQDGRELPAVPRTAKAVEFLVGDEAFERQPGSFVSLKPGVPIQINGIGIDLLSANAPELLAGFEDAMARAAAEE